MIGRIVNWTYFNNTKEILISDPASYTGGPMRNITLQVPKTWMPNIRIYLKNDYSPGYSPNSDLKIYSNGSIYTYKTFKDCNTEQKGAKITMRQAQPKIHILSDPEKNQTF